MDLAATRAAVIPAALGAGLAGIDFEDTVLCAIFLDNKSHAIMCYIEIMCFANDSV